MTKLTAEETADRDRRILELVAQGLKYREIATAIPCSTGLIANVVNRAKPAQADVAAQGANTKPVPATVTVARENTPSMNLAVDAAVIAEVIDTPETLDRQLRGCAREVDQGWARLAEAITAVVKSEVYDALGFKSLVAYLADVVDTEMPNLKCNVDLRRQMEALLDEQARMSQHAIGEVVGVDQRTVGRDLEQLRHDASVDGLATVTDLDGRRTGLDGKQRPAHPIPKPAPNLEPPQRKPPRRKPITEGFGAANYDLRRVTERLVRLAEDDRLEKYTEQIALDNLSDLQRAHGNLGQVIDALQSRQGPPEAAQKKLEAMRRQVRKELEAEFEARVVAEVQARLEYEIKAMRQVRADARRVLDGREGILTRADYDLIRSCLHPDSRLSASPEKLAQAFRVFNEAEILFLDEKDRPTPTAPLPSFDELIKRRGPAR